MSKKKNLKPIPELESDEAAERFVDEADLSEYDLSAFKPAHFEFEKKDSIVNLRVPGALLAALKATAAERGIPYQRLIREGMEKVVEMQSASNAFEQVHERIFAALQAAHGKSVAVQELSSKSGLKQQDIRIWFRNTGKKMGVVKDPRADRLKYVRRVAQ